MMDEQIARKRAAADKQSSSRRRALKKELGTSRRRRPRPSGRPARTAWSRSARSLEQTSWHDLRYRGQPPRPVRRADRAAAVHGRHAVHPRRQIAEAVGMLLGDQK